MSNRIIHEEEDDNPKRRLLMDRLKRLKRFLKESERLIDLILLELGHDQSSDEIKMSEGEMAAHISEDYFKELLAKRKVLEIEGLVREDDILDAIARDMKMERVDLGKVNVTQDLLNSIPLDIIREYHCFPVKIEQDALYVATSDPLDIQMMDDLRGFLKKKIIGMVCREHELEEAIKKYYGNI